MAKKLTQEEFIQKATMVHGNKYTYNKTIYKDYKTKVAIKCPIHGIFYQEPSSHLRGYGCPKCGKEKQKRTKEQFIQDALNIHKNCYDYSLVSYKDVKTKVKIKCLKCDTIFEQSPSQHLQGQGCPVCSKEKIREALSYTQEEWVSKARQIHGDKYDYSKVKYSNSQTKVCIICPEHGEFWQKAASHLKGSGCPKCAKSKQGPKRKTTEEFIKRAKEIHGDKYDYSKTTYIKSKEKLTIICKKHGEFQQLPEIHLRGCGCPKCKSSQGELFIKNLLEGLKINFEYQKRITYNDLNMRVDFYLELNNKKYVIEYNGAQHYKSVNFYGGEEQFKKQQNRDFMLREYCSISGITLVEIKYSASKEEITKFIKNLQRND